MKVKNNSKTVQMLPNFKAFEAGEERIVSKEESEIILRNSNFSEVKKEVKLEKTEKKSKSFNL
jgi:hypothetical protein